MKLKNIITIAALATPMLSIAQSQSFDLKGTINGEKPEKIMLYYTYRGQNYLDSTEVHDDRYQFKGLIASPERADLLAKYKNKQADMQTDIISFFLEPTTIEIASQGAFSNSKITGSPATNDFQKLKESAQPYEQKVSGYIQQAKQLEKQKDSIKIQSINTQIYQTLDQMRSNVYGNFVKTNTTSPIALYALQQYAARTMKNPDEIQQMFNALPENEKTSEDGKRFQQLIKLSEITMPGKLAPQFVQNDPNGNPISLSNYRGKYVLVYFWASICGPCRSLNPKLVQLYNQYHSKGLEIVGVSMDKATADGSGKEDWVKAIQEDKLPWPQTSDLRFWNNEVAKKYGVTSMPSTYLVDPKGIIVDRDLDIYRLREKLQTLLK